MSWYKKRLDPLWANQGSKTQPFQQSGVNFYHVVGKEFAYTINITDMKSKNDAEKISSALLAQSGVVRVKPLLHQKNLTVYFNPVSTSLSTIAHIISNLGYHHVRRG
ncbi:MAG: cation transporter [Peptococcaceae bacterium]|jgi:hypothetical protein|nr:cation transporter [Peptococcaceae bacterium]MDH7524339.1 cation transporter [Peptococcaceae bacterium]